MMIVDESSKDVEQFVRAHLDADAALSRAALSEPSDDVYLEREREAKTFYAPSTTSLGPKEGRWAVPGGKSPFPPVDVENSTAAGALYAVGTAGPDAWIAMVGSRRDLRGASISDALLVRKTSEGLRITGRASYDPFRDGVVFEPSGGESFDVDKVEHVTLMQEPTMPDHAAFLRRWGS